MPTDVGRALSIQQQYALELIAGQAAAMAGALLISTSQAVSRQEAEQAADEYEALLLGAMLAVAATRVGYLQAFTAAEGAPELDIPPRVLAPTVFDVLVGGDSPIPPPRGVGADIQVAQQVAQRAPSSQGAMWAALTELKRDLDKGVPDAVPRAQARIGEATESIALGTSDWVDAMVLGPNRTIAALRRVAHPDACDRCMKVARVLVFKTAPRLRHPRCRCSYEPVLVNDPEYLARLARYERNMQATAGGAGGSAWARDTRYRGRQQMERATFRTEDEFTQDVWSQFLRDEQTRLARLVQANPSDTYRNWAVMTSANQTTVGGDLLPIITRE